MAKILLRGNTPADQLIEINRPNHMYVFKPCEGGHVGNVEDKADIEAFQSMGGEIVKDVKAPKPAAKAGKPVDTQADTAEIELTGAEAVAKAKEEPEKKEKKAAEKKVRKPPKRGGK